MRAIVLKLFCWLCLTTVITTNVLAYQNTNSKTAYIESQWRHKLTHTKDHNNRISNNNNINNKNNHNRYASLLMGSSISSNSNSGSISGTTNSKPSWYKYDNNDDNNSKQATRSNSYNYNSNTGVRIRHSNKYPNLNNVWTRLEKMQPTTTTTPPPTTSSPYPYQSRYHYQNIKSSDKLFYNNNYNTDDVDDFDYEDEDESAEKDHEDLEPDYDKWETEEENKNDDFDDEDDLLDDEDEEDEDGWQAEEATEASPSSLTEYKWQHYGTRSRVEESRRNQYPEHVNSYSDIRAAIEHALKMDKETRCRDPLPRILSIQSIHPDPGKSYMPHCTVLHRCAEDTGCCTNHAMRCGPKRQTLIHLYFYTTTIGKPGSKVERLPFYNHTECACVDKSSESSTLDPSVAGEENNQEVLRSYRSSLSVRAADASHPQTIRRCKCPEEYTSRLYRGFHCTCDCVEGNIDCEQMKSGKEFFSLKDRLCILNDQCGAPSCEYGTYMRNIGRCPRKQEKFDAFANASADIH